MTDDELRRNLAIRLGIPIWKSPVTGAEYVGLPHPSPSLSELVATGEGRLTDKQKEDYIFRRLQLQLLRTDRTWQDYWSLDQQPAAVRAMALLEVLE